MLYDEIKEITLQLEQLNNHKCTRCGGALHKAKNLVEEDSKWFWLCDNNLCNSLYNLDFHPTDYQLDFLADDNQMTGYYGGFGAGKTASAAMKFFYHMISVRRGESLFGAAGWDLAYKSCIKEMNELMPVVLTDYFTHSANPKAGSWATLLKNGHVTYARVYQDEGMFRSLNLTGWWIEEASEVKYGIYNQLKTRLRSDAARTYKMDENGGYIMEQYVDGMGVMRSRRVEGKPKYLGVVTSNPDPGWIRTKLAFATEDHNLHYYGPDPSVRSAVSILGAEKSSYISTYIVSTYANYYLPPDFIPKNTAGKSQAWIERYINGSFAFADGLVYPQYSTAEVEPFEIPKNWRRIISADFGRREATAYIVGAVDPKTDTLYLYNEYYMPGGDWGDWIDGFWKLYNAAPQTSWLLPPIGDPAGQSRGQADATSWFEGYSEHGIHFVPSRTGKGSELGISSGIARVSDYFTAGKLKFFSTMTNFKMEISDYKYKTASLMEEETPAAGMEKPVAYKDHLMDALRGLVSMLPKNVGDKITSIDSLYVNETKVWEQDFYENEKKNDPHYAEFWMSGNKKPQYHSSAYEDDNGVMYGDFDSMADEYEGIW